MKVCRVVGGWQPDVGHLPSHPNPNPTAHLGVVNGMCAVQVVIPVLQPQNLCAELHSREAEEEHTVNHFNLAAAGSIAEAGCRYQCRNMNLLRGSSQAGAKVHAEGGGRMVADILLDNSHVSALSNCASHLRRHAQRPHPRHVVNCRVAQANEGLSSATTAHTSSHSAPHHAHHT